MIERKPKPTVEELKKELEAEQGAIRELMTYPAGKLLVKHWKKMHMHELFDKDPYVMAYRAALHDLIEVLIEIAEGTNDG